MLLLLCLISRITTTIYYIEDPDSLRFALAATDYDLGKLQPHFPGYPVFCFFLQILTFITGKFSIAFSMIGGISIFMLMIVSAGIFRMFFPSGNLFIPLVFIFIHPYFWLMSNRYMPDVFGLAVIATCVYVFLAEYIRSDSPQKPWAFFFLAGISLGVRLSFFPFLIPMIAWALWRSKRRFFSILASIAGVMIWLIPLTIIEGIYTLWETGTRQTTGHFYEWGGTMITEPSFGMRAIIFIRDIWADGMGGYWQDRGMASAACSIFLLAGMIFSTCYLIRKWKFFPKAKKDLILILFLSSLTYAAWIFFYQNILYQPRHVLPLLFVFVLFIAYGFANLKRVHALIFTCGYILSTSWLTFELIKDHKEPTAIAEVADFLEAKYDNRIIVAAIPLVNDYLKAHKINAEFVNVETGSLVPGNSSLSGRPLVVIGNMDLQTERSPVLKKDFFHNPYVNRIWHHLPVRIYE